jgi:hypothetical protein
MRKLLVFFAAFLLASPMEAAGITDADVASVLKRSDDLSMHSEVFNKVTRNLLNKGWCTLQDFRMVGGWVRRATPGREQHRIYVTYCGGSAPKDRLYLDATQGRVYR